MLVISRLRDESLVIGGTVVVTVVDIRGDKVRIGVESPNTISVHRQEMWEAIQREGEKLHRTDAPAPTKFKVTSRRPGQFGLTAQCEKFCDYHWLAAQTSPAETAAIALEAFKKAVADELESLRVEAIS